MKKNAKKTLLALLVLGAGIHQVIADPVNINITGNVVASPCIVNSGSSNLSVNLGTNIQASTLASAGAGTTPTPFDLALTSCPTGTSNVKVTFSGTAAAAPQTNMYVNTGVATPLAVELSQQVTGTILGNGSTLTQTVQTDRSVTYKLSARAVTNAGSVAPGSIIGVVQADFTYN